MLPGLGLDQYFSRADSSGTSAILTDELGSTMGLVNSSGAISTAYAYGPFGQTTSSGASSTNLIQYTGREMDPTGLYVLRARYYNPIAQRFISPDPIGLNGGQVNLYAYVSNNPMNWTDPLGLKSGSGGGGGGYGPGNWYGGHNPPPAPPSPPGAGSSYYEGVNSGATGDLSLTTTSTPTGTPTASPTPGTTEIITPPMTWDWIRYYFNKFVGYNPDEPPGFMDPEATRGSPDIPAPAAPAG
ncbi:MAG: RHS repeat-associated core domain-containing protein [Candidatus Binataceae bacterium]